ncbi:MAG: FHA domain-containing protein [Phycisphaerae bacterium]
MDVTLVMFKGDGQRKDFPLTGQSVTVGRSEDCDLRIPLLSVSRHHCQLVLAGDKIAAKDLGSSNGTYVNNRRISGEVALQAGDRVVVGPIVFTVQLDGEPQEIQPVKTKGQKMAEQGQAAQEVVDVDADVTARGGASDADVLSSLAGGQDNEVVIEEEEAAVELDPIAALEALASERDKDKKK